ncbi:lysosomal-trafficking regulator-like [Salvelinus namaycush]|uniref:Lysosomal-trafficking regulator-like n=1 Tax=Salvelinus namaycush TaxID=8040 RepID=A0A8U0Q834_SALNM|nr:lysosomal-trafficking regulator-like [Salvelinus namaycush]
MLTSFLGWRTEVSSETMPSGGQRCSLGPCLLEDRGVLWDHAFWRSGLFSGTMPSGGQGCSLGPCLLEVRAVLWDHAFWRTEVFSGTMPSGGQRCSLGPCLLEDRGVLWDHAFWRTEVFSGTMPSGGQGCSLGPSLLEVRAVLWDHAFWRSGLFSGTMPSGGQRCSLGPCLLEDRGVLWDHAFWRTEVFSGTMPSGGSRIGSEEAFYLYASGPDLTSIMPCKYGKPSGTFSKYVTTDGLKCDTVRELMMKNKDVDTAALIECLAVVYAPSSPRVYTIYEPVIRLKGQAKTMVSQRPFSSREVQSAVLETHVLRTMLPAEPQGLQNVLHKIGGTGSFVFLFARVVELSDSEQTQALALQVLLSLAKYNQHRINEMDCYHGYSMIHQVLIKSKCIVGYHILKTLLDGSCSSPILTLGEDGQFHLDTESTAVVQDIKLLSEVLLDWKIWAKAQGGVWETLLAALEILIRVHHPQQVFNIRQFLKAEVVHHFLLTCQVLQEHRDEHLTSIPQEVCLSFVKIIQEVLGSPPDLDLLRLVYNFLLAVHPPTNTYVCHTPTSFYFSLHIDGKLYQEKVQSIMYMRNINSGWKSAGSSAVSLSTAVFTEDPLPEGTIHLQPPSPEHGGDDQSLSLRPANLTPSPNSSPLLRPCVSHGGAGSPREGQEGEGVILGIGENHL